jgi:hypothetical protein
VYICVLCALCPHFTVPIYNLFTPMFYYRIETLPVSLTSMQFGVKDDPYRLHHVLDIWLTCEVNSNVKFQSR